MKNLIKTVLFFILLQNGVFGQAEYNKSTTTDTLKINFKNIYYLSATNIIPFSENVYLKNKKLNPSDYKISFEKCTISLSDSLIYSIFDTLIISYKSYLLGLKKEYKNRSLISKFDVNYPDSIRIIKMEGNSFSNESIFGRDIKKSGTIVRGFTVGTNKDFTVSSGLRLQLSGKLSDDIELTAALTDENTPIQPEGNSEKLEELDKVFIEIKHKNAIGTFGDYDFKEKIGEFGNLDRKLQGLKTDVMFDNFSGNFAYATSRGKFNSNKLSGTEGVQGPYRLIGANNETNIVVIAGSEKVFLDGEELKRGENNDYTIEYSNAEVTFKPKRLITSASRITVEFEYSDKQYSRTFLGGTAKANFYDNKLKVKFNYYSEGDDKNNPIDLVLSDNDKKLLENAGDDYLKAARTGVTTAEPDSLGRIIGTYTKVDTLINNTEYTYYVYNPGDVNAIYNVSFSYVGANKGDYISLSLGNFKFVGIGNGTYMPIKYLPMPQVGNLSDLYINYNPTKELFIELELAGSSFDKNTFSNLDDNDNYGYARNIIIELKPISLNLLNINLGKIGLNYKDRYVEDRFNSLDRINSVEFDRYYNITGNTNNNEVLREFGLSLLPTDNISIISKYGYLKKGNLFTSKRFNTDVKSFDEKVYNIEYSFDYVSTKNSNISSNWIRQNGKASLIIYFVKPGFEFASELKKDSYSNNDSLQGGSLNYYELSPNLSILNFNGLEIEAKYQFRNELAPLNGKFEDFSKSYTQVFSVTYKGIPEISTNNLLTIRQLKYSELYKLKGYINTETILFKSQSRFNFWKNFIDGDLYYETTTERSAKLEKVFIKVQKGTGNYIYLGDLNNNGLPEENEFEQTIYDGDFLASTIPTDELFPVINLKVNTRWKIDFSRLQIDNSFWLWWLKPISTETLIRIEENSQEKDLKQIYLLNLSKFLNDSTTIRGSNLIQQDIFLFKNSSELSFKYRYIQRKTLNNYSGGVERGYYRENTFRVKFALVKEIVNQTDFTTSTDNLTAPISQNRSRILLSNLISSDFSYRPYQSVEVGFIVSVGRDEDSFPEKPTIIDNNSQSIRFTLSFAGKGRLRIEMERKELVANNNTNIIPFEVTKGNNLGKNYTGSLNFDYRIGTNLQTTVNYSGRKLGESKIIHTFRAEARAFF
ncbi:MAG: hypothetical protein V1773_03985 [bacterium]